MKIIKLQSQLLSEIKTAEEVCIASAIVSDAALDFLLSECADECKLRLLIGIDLPTPDSVLERLFLLKSKNLEVKIFTKQGFFHPKLYLVNGKSRIGFIGSGNFTEGGLGRNIELFHKITEEEVLDEYQAWFEQYFALGSELTTEWLKEYSDFYKERSEFEAADKRRVGDFKRRLSGDNGGLYLSSIDFTNQFFKLHHHQAFEGNKPNQRTVEADKERYDVKMRLMELHDLVYPLIQAKGWNLHPHSMEQHIVSSYQHGEHTAESLGALWLHYGRSQADLDKFKDLFGENQSSLYHMRLQVLVHDNRVSIWLRVGKNNGSIVDRNNFKTRMKDVPYRDKFFQLLTALPQEFFIEINGEWRGIKSFKNSNELYEFVKVDDIKRHYFIIGTEYLPNAKEVSEKEIARTIIRDFEKMLPLYELIKTEI